MPDFSNPTDRNPQQVRDRATPHRPDPRMDDLIELRRTDPAAFRALALPPSQHIAMGLYETAREKAADGTAHTLGD